MCYSSALRTKHNQEHKQSHTHTKPCSVALNTIHSYFVWHEFVDKEVQLLPLARGAAAAVARAWSLIVKGSRKPPRSIHSSGESSIWRRKPKRALATGIYRQYKLEYMKS